MGNSLHTGGYDTSREDGGGGRGRPSGPGSSGGGMNPVTLNPETKATPIIGEALEAVINARGRQPGNYVIVVDATVFDDGGAVFTWKSMREPVENQRGGSLDRHGPREPLPSDRPSV